MRIKEIFHTKGLPAGDFSDHVRLPSLSRFVALQVHQIVGESSKAISYFLLRTLRCIFVTNVRGVGGINPSVCDITYNEEECEVESASSSGQALLLSERGTLIQLL